jgi:sporulation protein YlmC with PRC-barrel domain
MGLAAKNHMLVAANEVQGARVYDRTGVHLGWIDDIVIDRKTGNVSYAILSSGGFLGIGIRYHSLPWSMLTYDAVLGGYVIDVERAQLEESPAIGRWL